MNIMRTCAWVTTLAAFALGCGTTAEVRLRDGRLFDGKINYGDEDALSR